VKVELTPAEMMQGAMAGCMRQVENIKIGRVDAHGAGIDMGWQLHIEGALGEMAVAKQQGLYWAGKGAFRGDDAGCIQVRSTTHDKGRLILHREDADHDIFYLVTGICGKYMVRGWIIGHEGKQEKYWTDPDTGRPAFFVPQEDLNQ